MHIIFNTVKIKNFLSYGDVFIDLRNKGYCVIDGINNCIADNADNNGSGKSAITAAISFALTGETIQGLSSNLKNINVDENSCYVELDFSVDNNHYIITRSKNPKSDLTIFKDNIEISGKGIRESEQILRNEFPELTSQILASIAILGQGLPYKFSNNTPAGRKEVLESLSKSDYMIQDLKNRIIARQEILNELAVKLTSDVNVKKSNIEFLDKQKINYTKEFEELSICDINDLVNQITVIEQNIKYITNNKEVLNTDLLKEKENISAINSELTELLEIKNQNIKQQSEMFLSKSTNILNAIASINSQIKVLTDKINELEKINDICPTCGQKIPEVVKPDLNPYLLDLQELTKNLEKLESQKLFIVNEHKNSENNIEETFNADSSQLKCKLKQHYTNVDMLNLKLQNISNDIVSSNIKLNDLKSRKNNYEEKKRYLENTLYNLDLDVKKLSDEILYINSQVTDTNNRLGIINQMLTLTKRDFRGYLLNDIITFMDNKVKEYCREIFNTDLLSFTLNGNNIEIKYNNKNFENLSGGEQQKIDLIIQLSIRDMLKETLDISSNILFLDEILDNLDIIGCTNILNLISKRFTDIDSLFIISHRSSELSVPYDSKLTVIKDEKGISSVLWH